MDEKDYIILQYIYDEQNLTRAAERLYISQPALSYRVQQIEKDFKVKIFIKKGQRIMFTPEGEYLIQFAKKMLNEIRKTRDHLTNISNEIEGTLRIGVSNVFARYYLPKILSNLSNSYRKLQFEVNTGVSTTIMNHLSNNTIHLAIVRGDINWSEGKKQLSSENVCLISKDEISLEQLPSLGRINYNREQKASIHTNNYKYLNLNDIIQNWWNERFDVPPLITMEVDHYETCKEMVKHGFGYSIIPSIFITPEDNLYVQDLTRKSGENIKRNTWLFYREENFQLQPVKTFIDYVVNNKT